MIDKKNKFITQIKKNRKNLSNDNIFIFGIKPASPSTQYGYLLTRKNSKKIDQVTSFIEKPNFIRAKKILNKNGLWNSGMLLAKKISIINNFRVHDRQTLKLCLNSIIKSRKVKNVYHLDRKSFKKLKIYLLIILF